jgi:predicted amidophosphoribosyltransferase
MLYGDKARQIVLGLKYRDRQDYGIAAGPWLARTAAPLLCADTLIAPIPLHWRRLVMRRYNQAAVLSHALAKATGLAHCPDLLKRARFTGTQDGKGREDRFANVKDSILANPRQKHRLKGRNILLVDDVMTAGATFTAAAEACLAAGATTVCVVALARVATEA